MKRSGDEQCSTRLSARTAQSILGWLEGAEHQHTHSDGAVTMRVLLPKVHLEALVEHLRAALADEPPDDGLRSTCPAVFAPPAELAHKLLEQRSEEIKAGKGENGKPPLTAAELLQNYSVVTAPVGRPVSRQEALDASREILLRAEAARLPQAEPTEPDEEKAELRVEVARLTSYVRSVEDDCVVLMERYAKEHSPFKPGEGYEALLHAEELLVKHEGRECSLEQMRQWRRKWLEGRLDEVVRLVERIKRELP